MRLDEVRNAFTGFFRERDHAVVPSAPLVPDDPTLLFTAAGMVPFKTVFTGQTPALAPRAASVQKCVRAGGKHNDLDNVGYTARHHTFFEMLGNFSFGDYFKERAIELAWDFSTKTLALPVERILITVHPADDEARGLWRNIAGVSDDVIIDHEDNVWSAGPVGPAGYCSELFFDQGEGVAGGPPGSPEEDGDRFLEFWNLVFMQFENFEDGRQEALPRPSIDTGMGLERITAILQGVTSNYDIDVFRTLIAASVEATGAPAEGEAAASHRVVADHLRASAFLLADGVSPSNEGRGYVLRRIMRRAMRHAHLLGAGEPLMHRLAPVLAEQMGDAYPDLMRAQPAIVATLRDEEERFRTTLERGLHLLEEAAAGLSAGDALAGEAAFKLYDTYGFPLDLTQDALRPRGIRVDEAGFDAAMARQKAEARAHWAGSGSAGADADWTTLRRDLPGTGFTGYVATEDDGRVLALVRDGERTASAAASDHVEIVTDVTPFYAEGGGQVGDAGVMSWDGGRARVETTHKRAGDLHAHVAIVEEGALTEGEGVRLIVDAQRRKATRANHSATHLLHAALRRRLGPHVTQKGSYVGPDRLRFDFAHGAALSVEDMRAIEDEVNAVIRANAHAQTAEMTPEDAIAAGALALFGEKYGERVRVLTLGDDPTGDGPYSVELCGGTHVAQAGDIGLFVIAAESAVAAGVRRVEALTGAAAKAHLDARANAGQRLADLLKTPLDEAAGRLEAVLAERKALERELADARKQLAMGGGGAASGPEPVDVGGVAVLAAVAEGVGGKDLRALVDQGREKIGSGVAAFVGVAGGKAALAVGVTQDLVDRVDARALVRAGAEAVGGTGGGGRPDMAQAGGPDGSKANAAVDAIVAAVREAVSEGAA